MFQSVRYTYLSTRCVSRLLPLALVGLYIGAVHAQAVPPTPATTLPASAPAPMEVGMLSGNPPIKYYRMPLTPAELCGVPTIQVRLNNKIDAKLIFDTGANASLLRPELADELGLTYQKVPKIFAILGSVIQDAKYVTVDKVDVGDYIHASGMLIVTDLLTRDLKDQSIQGILSSDTLSESAVLFDFGKQTLCAIPNGNLTNAQLSSLGFHGGVASAISMTADHYSAVPVYTVKVRIGGRQHNVEGPFLLDTGSLSTSFVGNESALGVTPIRVAKLINSSGGGTATACRVSSMEVVSSNNKPDGSTALNQVECDFVAPHAVLKARTTDRSATSSAWIF